MGEQLIDRRKVFKYLGILAGTAAGQEFLASWMPGAPETHHSPAQAEPAPPFAAKFFKPDEYETVQMLTEMIIPTDDKPGAKEARVADYIDFIIFSAAEFMPGLQKQWTDGLAWLDRITKEKHGRRFKEISADDREKLLTEIGQPEWDPHSDHSKAGPGFAFYRLVKEMTVEGFYTSRAGLIDVLEYQGRTFLAEFPGCTHPEHQA